MESVRQRSSTTRRSRRIPNNVQCGDPDLSRKYFTRKHSIQIQTNDVRFFSYLFFRRTSVNSSFSYTFFLFFRRTLANSSFSYSFSSYYFFLVTSMAIVTYGTELHRLSIAFRIYMVLFFFSRTVSICLHHPDVIERSL